MNIGIGVESGVNLTTGSHNIMIGNGTRASSEDTSRYLNIGNLIFGTGVSENQQNLEGQVRIGPTTPSINNSTGALIIGGGVGVSGMLNVSTFGGSIESLSGNGEVNTADQFTDFTTQGINIYTLKDGVSGQLKIVTMVGGGGTGFLLPDTKTGFTAIVFNQVGDSVTLAFRDSLGWMVVSNYNTTIY